MTAKEIKNQLSQDIWDSYFKFCTVRNPFGKVVSEFYHNRKTHLENGDIFRRNFEKISKRIRHVNSILKIQFEVWLRSGRFRTSREQYFLDGECCVDEFIQFEDIKGGIERVCEAKGIPFQEERIPHLKNRSQGRPDISEHYNERSKKIVEKAFEYEIDRFAYSFPHGE
jgi:hypothetical protein